MIGNRHVRLGWKLTLEHRANEFEKSIGKIMFSNSFFLPDVSKCDRKVRKILKKFFIIISSVISL